MISGLLALLVSTTLLANTPDIALQPMLSGLDKPVQLVAPHDGSGDLFVAELSGRLLLVRGERIADTFLDVRDHVSCCDNGGLLSVVFHPRYALNGRLFLLYVDKNGDTVLARYQRAANDRDHVDLASGKILLTIDQPADEVPNHHGGTLQFGSDGFLYASIGDGGAYIRVTNRAQDLSTLLGKMLRIDVDRGDTYTIPQDNPFVSTAGARGEIWSYGLRNPWRFSFDRATGDVLLGDVGQDSFEEIDIAPLAAWRGANLGWPRMEGAHCYPASAACDTRGLLLPRLESSRANGCSITAATAIAASATHRCEVNTFRRLVLRQDLGGSGAF